MTSQTFEDQYFHYLVVTEIHFIHRDLHGMEEVEFTLT